MDWALAGIVMLLSLIAYRLDKIQEYLRLLVARSEPDDDEE